MRWLEVERRTTPSYDELQERYLTRDVPVILTDLARDWPALARWTPGFLRERYGARHVAVYDESFERHGRHYLRPFGTMPFGDYLDLIEAGPTPVRLFLFQLFRMAPELRADIRLPSWSDWLTRRFLVTFFGGGGGATTLHYDVDLPHVFHVVVHGRKEFYLFAASETPHLHRHPWTVRSSVNVRAPDRVRHPGFAGATGRRVLVEAGETLVIPAGHWHQVFYPGVSWGLSFRKYDVRRAPAGLYNLVVQETVDRLLARVAPGRWEAWKEQRSQRAPRRPGAMLQRP